MISSFEWYRTSQFSSQGPKEIGQSKEYSTTPQMSSGRRNLWLTPSRIAPEDDRRRYIVQLDRWQCMFLDVFAAVRLIQRHVTLLTDQDPSNTLPSTAWRDFRDASLTFRPVYSVLVQQRRKGIYVCHLNLTPLVYFTKRMGGAPSQKQLCFSTSINRYVRWRPRWDALGTKANSLLATTSKSGEEALRKSIRVPALSNRHIDQ